jgi:hypothetical protein
MPLPPIWALIAQFKASCSKEWTTSIDRSAYDNVIEAEHAYHKFFLTRHLHPTTFKKIVANSSCTLREGVSYRTVKLSYMAWVVSQSPSWDIWTYLSKQGPSFAKRVAYYDFSQVYDGVSRGYKLNETDSKVFQEFERQLTKHYGIEFEPLTKIRRDRTVASPAM